MGKQLWTGSEGFCMCINMDTQASKGNTCMQNNRQNQECAGGGLPPGIQMDWKEVKIFKGFAHSQSFNMINVSVWWAQYTFYLFVYYFSIFLPFFLWRHLKTSNSTEIHQGNWSHTSNTDEHQRGRIILKLEIRLFGGFGEQNTKHTFIQGQSLLHWELGEL